jgi:hypothetical protein
MTTRRGRIETQAEMWVPMIRKLNFGETYKEAQLREYFAFIGKTHGENVCEDMKKIYRESES